MSVNNRKEPFKINSRPTIVFLFVLRPVHTYSDIFFNPQLSLPGYACRPPAFGESGYFLIRSPDPMNDVAKSCPVSYGTINQYGGTTCEPCFSRENLDTIRCVWTGEFDLNMHRVDREIFESRKKSCQIKIYPDTWMGP